MGLRFHDLRGSHETVLLTPASPFMWLPPAADTTPQFSCGPDARRTRRADVSAAAALSALSLLGLMGPKLGPSSCFVRVLYELTR